MKVIIIGKGEGWEDAPIEGETWGVNDLVLRRPVKLVFQMHDIDKRIERKRSIVEKEIREINRLGIPIITQKKHKLFPTAIPFPLDEMPARYFTSSFAYMVAYAIYKKANEIDVYGVPLYLKEEYQRQRACIEFWFGIAAGKGIKVAVYGTTILLSSIPHEGLYGYDW